MGRRKAIAVLALMVAASGAWSPAGATQKSRWIPVQVEYSVPPGLKTGDEVTTVFTFTATADVPKLEVKLKPVKGLEWLEGEKVTTFESVDKGQQRQVKVRLRLTADRGQLSLVVRAFIGGDIFGDTALVEYGAPAAGAHE